MTKLTSTTAPAMATTQVLARPRTEDRRWLAAAPVMCVAGSGSPFAVPSYVAFDHVGNGVKTISHDARRSLEPPP